MDGPSTMQILDKLLNTENLDEVLSLEDTNQKFPEYLRGLLAARDVDTKTFAQEMMVSLSYVYHLREGTRSPSRDTLIKIALLFKLGVVGTQRLLRMGERNALYAKVRRDAVLIYALSHGCTVDEADAMLRKANEQPFLFVHERV